jgi:Nucleopolyhedrovirus telokin-like protein-20 (TLP20)
MATNNSGTIDISVYVTMDQTENENVLSFIVRDEYHLKKLAVGAYNLNILDTQLLRDINEHDIRLIACGDYVITYNFTEQKGKLNVILFNIKPLILKKENCIFKLIYPLSIETNARKSSNSQLFKSTFITKDESTDSDSNVEDDDDNNNNNNNGGGPPPLKKQKFNESETNQV